MHVRRRTIGGEWWQVREMQRLHFGSMDGEAARRGEVIVMRVPVSALLTFIAGAVMGNLAMKSVTVTM